MKWQSYLMFLEQAYDRDLQEDLAIDYSDHLVSLIELLECDPGLQSRKFRCRFIVLVLRPRLRACV